MSVNETLTAAQPVSPSEEIAQVRLLDLVDDRTRELIEKRRGSVRRRGWLVRRALAVADATGILLAFALTQVLFPPDVDPQYDRIGTHAEIVLFALTLPLWIVLGRIYNLYSSDEQRTDHTERRRVLRRLQHAHRRRLALLRARVRLRFREPELSEARALLGARDRARPRRPRRSRVPCAGEATPTS